jgi:hypothetical protein
MGHYCISSDYWEISPPGIILHHTLGNLLCFWDSVESFKINHFRTQLFYFPGLKGTVFSFDVLKEAGMEISS